MSPVRNVTYVSGRSESLGPVLLPNFDVITCFTLRIAY